MFVRHGTPELGDVIFCGLVKRRRKIKASNGSYSPKWIKGEEWTKLKASWDTNEFKTKSKIKAKKQRRGVEEGQADATYGRGSQFAAKVMDKMVSYFTY